MLRKLLIMELQTNSNYLNKTHKPDEVACQFIQCQNRGKILRCSGCFSGFYCCIECQKNDWVNHKDICKAVSDTTRTNPWYSKIDCSTKVDVIEPQIIPEECEKSVDKFKDHIKKLCKTDHPFLINTTRTQYGASLLHIAVIHGDLETIKLLISLGLYVNLIDWRRNTPLYYACSHKGSKNSKEKSENGVNVNNTNLSNCRIEIVKYLVRTGADTMMQGSFSGYRPHEAARHYGYNDVADLLENSQERLDFCDIRNKINSKINDKKIRMCVKSYIDVFWRTGTAEWMMQPNRKGMNGNFNPHPFIINNTKNVFDLEKTFQDCATRHNKYWFLFGLLTDYIKNKYKK